VDLTFDSRTGLLPAIAQDRLTGQVRMVAYMNREALERTLSTGNATFFSRERQRLWTKGETSGNVLKVQAVFADCDADTLVLLVDPAGPSCHTGRPSCFFRKLDESGSLVDQASEAQPFLQTLEAVIEARQLSTAERSYTRSLLDGGALKIGDKLREEADELARALASESDDRVLNEAADLLFHALVGLRSRGLAVSSVLHVLAERTGTSGHAEKASRSASKP
jgi:phosphoribosyl-ATP pyrophosphohydrolase/phosphoribosyl-AMP cyclohydrolase